MTFGTFYAPLGIEIFPLSGFKCASRARKSWTTNWRASCVYKLINKYIYIYIYMHQYYTRPDPLDVHST